jgi:hypothetical protein
MPKRRNTTGTPAKRRGRPPKAVPEPPSDMLITHRELAAGGQPFCRVGFSKQSAGRQVIPGPLVAPAARDPMAGYPLGQLRLRDMIDDSMHDAGLEFAKLYSMVYGLRRRGADLMQNAIGQVRREFLDELGFEEKYNSPLAPAVIRQRKLARFQYTQELVDLTVNEIIPGWIDRPMIAGRLPVGLVSLRLQLDNWRGIARPQSDYFNPVLPK